MDRQPLHVLVQHKAQAEAALELARAQGLEIELVCEAGLMGPAFVKALEDTTGREILAYCDDNPGLALGALAVGLRTIVMDAAETEAQGKALGRLADIARKKGGRIVTPPPRPLYGLAAGRRRFVVIAPARPAPLGAGPTAVP